MARGVSACWSADEIRTEQQQLIAEAPGPFAGSGVSEVLAEVLKGSPEWTALPAHTPPLVRRVLRRCLDKDRRERDQPRPADTRG